MDPFEIPADIHTVEDLAAAIEQARAAYASERQGDSPDMERLAALVAFIEAAQTEQTARAESATQLADLDSRMTASESEPETATADDTAADADAADGADDSAAADGADAAGDQGSDTAAQEAAARRTPVTPRQAAASSTDAERTPAVPANGRGAGRMVAAVTAGRDYREGEEVDFTAVGQLAATRIDQWSKTGKGSQDASIATLHREFPDELVATSEDVSQEMLNAARQMARLDGGTLQPRTFDASTQTFQGGWCAPSETLYDRFCPGPSMDGIWSVPEINARRGGVRWPRSPDFCEIYNDPGFVIFTEEEMEEGVEKPCIMVPCPPFGECRLDALPLCLLGGLLQRAAYPESVADYVSRVMVAHAHYVNAQKLARVEAQSTEVDITASTYGAAAPVLGAVELAVQDLRDAYRLSEGELVEIVLPFWVRGVIRSDLARRAGVDLISVPNERINGWLRERGAVPQFVYDWQPLGNPGISSPGESPAEDCPPVPVTAWPTELRFLVYPAGTWVGAVADVINLNTFYDSTLLRANEYGIQFSETGFCLMDACPGSRVYTVDICADGRTGIANGTGCQV